MRPLHTMLRGGGPSFRGLFFDIDDTLATDGRLAAAAYGAMERLREVPRCAVASDQLYREPGGETGVRGRREKRGGIRGDRRGDVAERALTAPLGRFAPGRGAR